MGDVIIPVTSAEHRNYVIGAQKTAQTKVIVPKQLTNQEALRKIANYLDNATAYLRKKRLEAQH